MRATHRRRRAAVSAALLALTFIAACTTSEASAPGNGPEIEVVPGKTPSPSAKPGQGKQSPLPLVTFRGRKSDKTVAYGGGDAPYDYAPSVLLDGGRYRMWWCSQLGVANPAGDDIVMAEARSMDGPFAGPDGKRATPIFSGRPGGFDAMHTCDPSVVRVDGVYYMYYTGAAGDHAHGNAIGLAVSRDGRVWSRVNEGKPIVRSARHVSNGNTYGAGQPSVLFLGDKFYLMFTDTTGEGAGRNGAGQFVLRSRDPKFSEGVEALGPDGFEKVPDTSARGRTIVDAFSADWMWVDSLAAFAVAHETSNGTLLTFWDIDFHTNPYDPVLVPGIWREGPGLVRRPDGHAIVSTEDPCGTLPLDLVRATKEGRHGPADLRHFGLDVGGFDACKTTGRALLALDGFAMPSPQRTIDLVINGELVRVDRRSVAEKLAVRVLDGRVPSLDDVKVAARLRPGAEAVAAPGRGTGFVIDHRLWRFDSADVAAMNSSSPRQVSDEDWDAYDRGPDLDPSR
ncbi:beta-xylosidase [Actinophytocola sp.]|jgi:hypothetical protein|uniref:beta-xylosidase n=1 Tax=Actinophytocola sp. TaxID=1872138 RepID=UPI0039C8A3F8